MHAVFYDLETSDKCPIGQILNYCFIAVDEEYKTISELSGLIRISRLQLPDPGAILANRIDVIEHQREATDHERDGMAKICRFLNECIDRAGGAIALIGYNSSRFDLSYLRTSLIRNGYNPYFGGKIVPRDLLHAVQYAYVSHTDFAAKIRAQRGDEPKLSLSLQTVTHALGLLEGAQAHESRADVLLTIEVARWLKAAAGINPVTFEAYQGGRLHSTARSGAVYLVREPEYELGMPNCWKDIPVAVLDADNRAALWVDIGRYIERPDPRAIMWRSAARHSFFVETQASSEPSCQRAARRAMDDFKGVTLRNFFKRSTCDVEQDIYRVDFDGLDILTGAIHRGETDRLEKCESPEVKVLWTRYRLVHPDLSISNARAAEMLRKYAMHRYGGTLQLARNIDEGAKDREGDESHHPSLAELWRRLSRSQEAALVSHRDDDLRLLNSLETFYRTSEIASVAGSDLVPEWGKGNRAVSAA